MVERLTCHLRPSTAPPANHRSTGLIEMAGFKKVPASESRGGYRVGVTPNSVGGMGPEMSAIEV